MRRPSRQTLDVRDCHHASLVGDSLHLWLTLKTVPPRRRGPCFRAVSGDPGLVRRWFKRTDRRSP